MNRIGYIGSKYKLKDWIFGEIQKRTDSTYTKFADLFAGSCIMTHEALERKYECFSNDLEPYSHIIANGLKCDFTSRVKSIVDEINNSNGTLVGFITNTYSPKAGRLFFTEENAMRIDYIRNAIENMKPTIDENIYYFLLASLITSADAVKNTSVVYGAYLKKVKKTAIAPLVFKPIHTRNSDVNLVTSCNDANKLSIVTDVAYIDPPYNNRQYGANYFILNQIIDPQIAGEGVTGISDYNKSSFCYKKEVENAFNMLLSNIKARMFVISYNSESLISKGDMIALLTKYGRCEVIEREYKRFKAQQETESNKVMEFLFFVHISSDIRV
jgi:adenine-specific DNA-methyltransferase